MVSLNLKRAWSKNVFLPSKAILSPKVSLNSSSLLQSALQLCPSLSGEKKRHIASQKLVRQKHHGTTEAKSRYEIDDTAHYIVNIMEINIYQFPQLRYS